jgi:hypothetical protein
MSDLKPVSSAEIHSKFFVTFLRRRDDEQAMNSIWYSRGLIRKTGSP